jgi:hypothetical protein
MNAKAKRIILDSVKDHFISYNKNKKIGKDMFGALVELFQNSYVSHQTLLRNQLTSSYDEDKYYYEILDSDH